MTTTTTAQSATDKQINFIVKLLNEKDWSHFGEDTLADAQAVQAGTIVPRKHASQLIDALLSCKKAVVAATPAPAAEALTEGIYAAPNGDVIKVKKSKAGHMYAQVMISKTGGERINLLDEKIPNFDFVYVSGLIKYLTPQMKLTVEDAKAFYTKTGRCLNCKKALKVATSIEKGLGPTCAKMFA